MSQLYTYKKKLPVFFFFLLQFCAGISVYGQQVIGSFPEMDGGFENQSSIATLSSVTTGSTQTGWTISSACWNNRNTKYYWW